jgi:hypothetical protein
MVRARSRCFGTSTVPCAAYSAILPTRLSYCTAGPPRANKAPCVTLMLEAFDNEQSNFPSWTALIRRPGPGFLPRCLSSPDACRGLVHPHRKSASDVSTPGAHMGHSFERASVPERNPSRAVGLPPTRRPPRAGRHVTWKPPSPGGFLFGSCIRVAVANNSVRTIIRLRRSGI